MLVGSIEAGGTKFVCAVGDDNYNIVDSKYFITEKPSITLKKVIDYFKNFKIEALGIASFGPLELRQDHAKYGYITTSPKLDWRDTDLYGILKAGLEVPIYLTTDVNGSTYGEYIMSRMTGEKINSLAYYTIGTGVGAGIINNGQFIGDLGHPEMGHVNVKRHPKDMAFAGTCPYHGDCLEGLVSGPTFEARLGKRGETVPQTNFVWDIMAYYVAQALIQTTLMFRPGKIVLGGGVMNGEFLKKIKQQFVKLLNGYVSTPAIDNYIVMPLIKHNGSATIGDFALALTKVAI
ncbi:ROK family protein [Agrilactobacillus yilanensis]|uniref:fructokinase n=1 Tax=Agrilactobacillus yilanensis TaxID=2485997 RepID=A0ABW4J513_9LACO|nr:ROK family protein [Agrilactobacillus yilanensis]